MNNVQACIAVNPMDYSALKAKPIGISEAAAFEKYPDLLTVQHIKEITGLSEQTIRAEINLGELPGCRIGRRLYVPKCKFIEYVENRGGLND